MTIYKGKEAIHPPLPIMEENTYITPLPNSRIIFRTSFVSTYGILSISYPNGFRFRSNAGEQWYMSAKTDGKYLDLFLYRSTFTTKFDTVEYQKMNDIFIRDQLRVYDFHQENEDPSYAESSRRPNRIPPRAVGGFPISNRTCQIYASASNGIINAIMITTGRTPLPGSIA
jgi:hypothetical protein